MLRRQLLSYASTLAAGGFVSRLQAATPQADPPRLLLVFLRGAYDSNNLLVPTHSDFYYQARPTIAVPRSGETNGALDLDGHWGLHPMLQDSIYPLFQEGQVSFIPFAGTNDLSRSHFETQDSIELGQPLQGRKDYQSGFLNRLTQLLQQDRNNRGRSSQIEPIAFTDQLPLMMRGKVTSANISLASLGKSGVNKKENRLITSMYEGTPLGSTVQEGFAVRDSVLRSVQVATDQAGRSAISAKGFALVAQRMAVLMRDSFDLGFVDVCGWDTHVNQGGATGALANRLKELGTGLTTFSQEIGPQAWKNTVVVVISEFGRTFRENGAKGTDHGHGTTYWVMGGGLASRAGGHVVGEQVEVNEKNLFQNRDYPILNEYRSVLSGLFQRMYGLSTEQVQQVFSSVTPKDLRLI